MENRHLAGFEVTRIQGGMAEFTKTGIYPDYLYFDSGYYRHKWKQKCNSDHQEGSLKLTGRIVFEYKLSEKTCKIRAIHDDLSFSEWTVCTSKLDDDRLNHWNMSVGVEIRKTDIFITNEFCHYILKVHTLFQ